MKSTIFFKTFTCVGILLIFSGIANCQRRTATRQTGPRLISSGVRSRSPALRVRNMGGMSAGPLTNQTTSRRGSPRLLGFIIPNSRGGRPQLRLMPGAQDFIRPGRRIAAAPLSQLQRLGVTGIPTSLLGRSRTRSGVRGSTRGSARGPVRGSQIRRLPQSALNTINAARGRTPTRQPNIVFVRPPTSSRATGLTPDLIRQIRLTALRRAAAQRAAASGRRGIRRNQTVPQPTARLRNMQTQNGVGRTGTILRSRAGPRSRAELEAVRRRISAMNAARGRTAMPARTARPVAQVPQPPQAPRQTEIRRSNIPRPTRVDEAVLRANIVPAGLTPGSDGLTRVVSSSSSSSESSTSTSSSSKTSTVSSSGVNGIGSVVQTGIQAVQPVATVIAPSPELEFRTGVDDTASAAVVAPATGLVASVPILETGPSFEVVSNVASPTIVAQPGTAISQAVSLDIGAAAGPAMVVNPTVIDNTESLATLVNPGQAGVGIAAVKPVEEATIISGSAIRPVEDVNLVAAVAGPSISGSAVSALVPAVSKVGTLESSDAQLISSLPDLGQLQVSGLGTIVPGAAVGQLGTGDVATSLAKSNPDMHSLKSVITDVLRDMAVHGTSSNVEPDISMVAQAVLDAQRKNDAASLASASHAHVPHADHNMHHHDPHVPHADHNNMHHHDHPVLQQTFTLGPENPSLIVQPLPIGSLLTNTTSSKHGHSTFFGPKETKQQELLTTKPAITDKMSTDKKSTLIPGLTDSAISAGLDILHTQGPHDFTAGITDITSLLAGHAHMPGSAHDSIHHPHSPGPPHDILLHTHSPGSTHDTVHHGHTGTFETTKHKNTQTAKLQPTTAAPKTNDQLNLIVGDWTGADKTLSPPPPPPTTNLGMDHSHGHGHFHDHTHGFTEPAIPRPPPLAETFATSGLPSHSDPTSASVKQSANKVKLSNDKIKDTSISANKKSGFGDVLGMNNHLPSINTAQINSKAGVNLGQGNDRLSNLFLDMAQLEQVLGLNPNSLAASQAAQTQPNSGSSTDSANMQSFLTELSSLFGNPALPREMVNSPVIKESLANITQPVGSQLLNDKNGKGTPAILSTTKELQPKSSVDNSASSGKNKSVQSADLNTPTKAKSINASASIDKSVDLKKSSSTNNQTISKRVRQINITTTITKKSKPVLNDTTEKGIKRNRKARTKKGRRRGRVGNDLGVNFAADTVGVGNELGVSYAPDLGITGNNLGVNFDASGLGVTDSIISGSVGTGMGVNGGPFGVTDPARANARADALDTVFDALGEGGMEDFSANNMQGMEGVSIAVPSGAPASDVTIDNINTIAIENKLFDANMPMATGSIEIPSTSTLDTKPLLPVNVVAETPLLDTSQPLGEQLMKQLPVPQELVNALSGGSADIKTASGNSLQDNMNPAITDSLILGNAFREVNSQTRNIGEGMPDQGFSLNNVRDGLIVDAVPPIIQTGTVTTDDTNLKIFEPSLGNDRLSAPSLDKLAMNIPSDILTPNNIFDKTLLTNTASATSVVDQNLATINTDPTIRKIATILPTPAPKLPLMTLDAKGFSAEGRFNAVQQGFNKTTRLSSKNGINVEMQLSPFFTSKTESSHSETTKQVSRTANIQTDGSFLGSPLPVPPRGAGPGIPLSSASNEMPFYDQTALLGSLNQMVPIDVPVLPPPVDIPLVPDDATRPAVVGVTSVVNEIKPDPAPVPDMPLPPAVSFTSTFDVPTTFVADQNIVPSVDTTGGAVQTEFVSLENNPNWAVFDPTAVSADINFNDINPVINGVIAPGPEIAFVNTNDITFTNAFDVAPVAYDPAPSAPATGAVTDSKTPQQNSLTSGSPETTSNTGGSISKSTDTLVDTMTNGQPSNSGMKFEEVVIAPLPFDSNRNVQSSMDFPPPPPI